MGREEGKAQPNQTWSRLLGSTARVSGSAPGNRRRRSTQQKGTAAILHRAQRARNSYRAFHSARRLSSNHRGRILAQRQGTL